MINKDIIIIIINRAAVVQFTSVHSSELDILSLVLVGSIICFSSLIGVHLALMSVEPKEGSVL